MLMKFSDVIATIHSILVSETRKKREIHEQIVSISHTQQQTFLRLKCTTKN